VRCRMCDSCRLLRVLDFGAAPPCEKFLTAGELDLPESTFPFHLRLCEDWEHAFRFTIHDPAQVDKDRPDVVLALPWNLETALTEQLAGGQLVYPLPTLHTAAIPNSGYHRRQTP
jgi:hypothetical protein